MPGHPSGKPLPAIGSGRLGYPQQYPYSHTSIQRWCTKTLPAFFQGVFGRDSKPELFDKFGANNSNSGLSATGMHIWTLARDCLRSERLPPFDND